MTTLSGTICIDEAASAQWDVLVIGAGPAGAAAAHLLAQRGVATLLVERQTWPRRKACGGCLNGSAISLLKTMRLDHVLTASHAVPLDGLVLQANRQQVELEISGGAAIDRMAFDAALVETAVESGTAFLPGTTATVEPTAKSADVRSVRLNSPGETGRTVDARIVLVADGLGHPSLKQISSIDSQVQQAARVGLSLTIDELPASYCDGKIFMAISRAGYVGVVRIGQSRGNLAAAIDPVALRDGGGPARVVQSILRESGLPAIRFPEDEAWRGTPQLTRRSNRLSAWRIFLLGDAVGYSEPFTGEGIGWALASAFKTAPVAIGNLERWDSQAVHEWETIQQRQSASGQVASRLIAGLLRRPMAVGLAIRALGLAPFLARPLVHRIHQSNTCQGRVIARYKD